MTNPSPPSTSPNRDRTLLTHTALVALTPLIPLPVVDDMAMNRVQRRMVHQFAHHHGLTLQPHQIALLANSESGKLADGIVKGLVFTPLRAVLRKTFMVLAGNKIAEVASCCYHRGFLIERAFAHNLCAPDGPHPPSAIREAVDEVMATVPVASSPVTAALRAGLSRSHTALADLSSKGRSRAAPRRGRPAETEVEQAVDEATEGTDGNLDGIVGQLRHALNDVPAKHFDALERSLCNKLGSSA